MAANRGQDSLHMLRAPRLPAPQLVQDIIQHAGKGGAPLDGSCSAPALKRRIMGDFRLKSLMGCC